jgi:hypothetical protein
MKQKYSIRARLANWLMGNKPSHFTDKWYPEKQANLGPVTSREKTLNLNGAVTFSVYSASGGYIVETNYYNESTDRHTQGLHIITDTENFNEELGRTVFMTMLKNR